jgi:hypothetical protein
MKTCSTTLLSNSLEGLLMMPPYFLLPSGIAVMSYQWNIAQVPMIEGEPPGQGRRGLLPMAAVRQALAAHHL